MAQSDLVTKKIGELIDLARIEGDTNTQIILLALRGAQCSNDDGLLAMAVQKFIDDVLMPKTQRNIDRAQEMMN